MVVFKFVGRFLLLAVISRLSSRSAVLDYRGDLAVCQKKTGRGRFGSMRANPSKELSIV